MVVAVVTAAYGGDRDRLDAADDVSESLEDDARLLPFDRFGLGAET